jgi:hypothetical protein
MKSEGSTSTVAVAGLTEFDVRAKGDYEGARIADNQRRPSRVHGNLRLSLTKTKSWRPAGNFPKNDAAPHSFGCAISCLDGKRRRLIGIGSEPRDEHFGAGKCENGDTLPG